MTRFEQCFGFTVKEESDKWSNDTRDGGNWTGGKMGVGNFIGSKYGISAYMLKAYLKTTPSIRYMQNLSLQVAAQIAYTYFWKTINGDSLFAGLDLAVFDFGYNTGPRRSVKLLQSLVGSPQDGIIGEGTLKAINKVSIGPSQIIPSCMACLTERYSSFTANQLLIAAICSNQYQWYMKTQSIYADSWENRTIRRLQAALDMEKESNAVS